MGFLLRYVAPILVTMIPLVFVATRSKRHTRAVLAAAPLIVVIGLVAFGLLATARDVQDCTDCRSDYSIFGLDVLGNERIAGGFGANFYAGLGWLCLLAIGLTVTLVLWARRADSAAE